MASHEKIRTPRELEFAVFFDEAAGSALKMLKFDAYSEEWLDFVLT